MIQNAKISDVMTREVKTVFPDDSVRKVQELFEMNHFHHLPVVDDNHTVLGMISRSDFNLLCDKSTIFDSDKSKEINERFFKSIIAKDIMTKQVLKLKEDDPITKAVDIIRENLFHGIPVVDHQMKLIGVVTSYDLLTFAYNQPLELK